MKKRGMGLWIVLLAGLLIGCSEQGTTGESGGGVAESAEPAEGGTVTVAANSEPGNLNPAIWATTSDTNVTHMVFDSLVIPDEELKMQPSLAKEWEVSEDGTSYTFYLEENVTWHDGEAFTADDVAFTLTSLADQGYDAGAYWRVEPIVGASEYHAGEADGVEGIEVVDDYTIKLTTKDKFAPFISGLFIGIVPEHILGDVAPSEWEKHESNRSPIGTGPFSFVKWETGQYIELEKNAEYFKSEPHLDRVIVRFGDANSMLASYMNDEVDITPVAVSETPSVESLDGAELVKQNQLSVYYVGFNALNDHFSDTNVRQALAYAIDKNAIVDSILGEYGTVAHDVFPSQHWSHSDNVTQYTHDPEQAEKLLQEAGYEKGSDGIYEKQGEDLSFTFEVPTGTKEREQSAVLLKQMWENIGVKAEIRSLDFPTLVTKLLPKTDDGTQREVTADDYDAYILGFGVEADPDEYRTYFGSDFMPPNGYNFVSYSDEKVDELLAMQAKETDFEKRQEMIWQVGEKLSEDEIWIPIYEQDIPIVYNTKVGGFEPDFRGITFTAEDWYLQQ